MHLFALPDASPKPETAEGLTFIGRITLQDHMAARGFWADAEAHQVLIHPFEDTRLTQQKVIKLHSLAVKNAANKDLVLILERAIQSVSGLMSFVD